MFGARAQIGQVRPVQDSRVQFVRPLGLPPPRPPPVRTAVVGRENFHHGRVIFRGDWL